MHRQTDDPRNPVDSEPSNDSSGEVPRQGDGQPTGNARECDMIIRDTLVEDCKAVVVLLTLR